MTAIPFVTLTDPRYGEAVQVAPLIRRVVAHNPSKFTYLGTGTYIVGGSERGDAVAVIDPGPALDAHRDALAAAIDGQIVAAILVTHCHADHSPLAAWLRAETGAPTLAHGPHPRPAADEIDDHDEIDDDDHDDDHDGDDGDDGGAPGEPAPAVVIEETTDYDFTPDVGVVDGEIAARGRGWTMRAVHTPGHTSNHTSFTLDEQGALFTGDHIMGWSTTVIGPPDGDMRAYFDSLRRVQARRDRTFWPTHGAPVTDTAPFVDAFIAHRLEREANVLAAVRSGVSSIKDIVRLLYADVRKDLHAPARRSVLAHLEKLVDDGAVTVGDGGRPRLRSVYQPS